MGAGDGGEGLRLRPDILEFGFQHPHKKPRVTATSVNPTGDKDRQIPASPAQMICGRQLHRLNPDPKNKVKKLTSR